MKITKQTTGADVLDLLSIHTESYRNVTMDDAESYARMLIVGYAGEDTDSISTLDLQGLALTATRPKAQLDADGYYIRPEPIGENRDAWPLHERFTA